MTTPQVWVSTTSPQVDYDGQSPGDHWELVGTIDMDQEHDIRTHLQTLLGLRQTASGRPDFYLDGDPGSNWTKATDRKPFWVAIDPWGQMRSRIHGARPTYFVSKAQAAVTSLTRRAPETHPGLAVKPIKVPIRLERVNGEVFTKWEQPDA